MPGKSYEYKVTIGVLVNTRGLKSGTAEVTERLSSWERQAQRAIEKFEKLSRAIEKAEKANSRVSNGGGQRVGGIDNAMLKAMADIARMQRQAERGEKELTRTFEREAKAQASAKAREMRRAADSMIREIDRVNRAETRQYSGRNNLPSGGILGKIVGGNLFAEGLQSGLSAITSLLGAAADKSVELGIASVKLAGDFEITTNALAAFTGSTRSARAELAQIDETARNTAGLRLIPAEEGFQRLRALGFQAEQARAFIKELGEEKLLSGASDEALDRIIFNFAQIASGGQKVSQELREILTAMPTLRNAFYDAFGTLDPKKIQTFFDKNTDEAFKRLTDAMAKQKSAAGGLNDAWGKVSDELIQAGRSFGEPFLKPVTEDLKNLSKYLRENGESWKEWGESTKNVYLGVVSLFQKFDSSEDTFLGNSTRRLKTLIGWTKYLPGSLLGTLDDLSNEGERVDMLRKRARQSGIMGAKTQDQIDSENEVKTAIVNTQQDIVELEQKAIQQRLDIIKTYYDEKINIIQVNSRIELAAVDAVLTDTIGQEIEVIQKRQKILEGGLQQQIEATRKHYTELIQLNVGNETEQLKLQFEGNQKLRGLTADLIESQIKFQKDLAEKEKRILEDRRQAQIRFAELEKEIGKSRFDNAIFDIERALERQTVTTEEGYSQLLEVTNASFAEQIRLSRQSYELQLKDLSLTVEQRENLMKQMYFAEEKLAEDNRRAILEIEDNRYKDQVRRLEQFTQRQKAVFESQASIIRGMAGFFDSSDFDKQSYQAFRTAFMGDNIAKEIDRLIGRRQMAYEAYDKFVKEAKQNKGEEYLTGDFMKDSGNAAERVRNLDEVIKQNQNILTEYQRDISDTAKEIDKLGKELTIVAGAYRNFDEIAKKSLQSEQEKQMASANLDLLLAESKFKIASARERSNLQYLADANKPKDGETATKEFEDAIKALDAFDKAIADTSGKNVNGFTLDMLEARNAIRLTKDAITNLTGSQEQQKLDQYRNSIEGLTESIKNLSGGDIATMNALTDIFKKDSLRQQKSDLIEIRRLEYEIANAPIVDSLAIQKAYLEDILSLRHQETNAIIASNRAELELSQAMAISANQIRARVLEHLASQKTLNESFADGIIAVYDKVGAKLDENIDKMTEKLGIFGSLIGEPLKAIARNTLTNFTKGVLDNFLPPELSAALNKTGNPIVDQQIESNKYLKSIDSKLNIGASNQSFQANSDSNSGGLWGLIKTLLGGNSNAQTGNSAQSVQNIPQIINTQGGGSAPVISSQQMNAVTQSGQMQIGGGSGVNTTIGANIPTLTTNNTPQSLGGAMQQVQSGLPTVLAGRNRSVRNMPTGSIVDGSMVVNGRSRFSQMFGKGGIFGEQGFGFNSGTISTVGALGGMAGSLIGGPVGSIMMGAASGIGMMSSLSSILGITSLGGPVGLAIGAAIGGVIALGSVLFGRNKQRKADEKTRNTAMGDAFKAIDKLISDVNSDKIDGDSALSQADEIRKNYVEQMGQLKDGKTRRIALADVARIDAKISTLKSAVTGQQQRKDKMLMLTPTFADGGGVSDFISSNYRNNPLGYVQGPGSSRSDSISAWFPVAGTHARISNREYVLDAETTRNVGVWNLDRLRAGKGKNLGEISRMMNRTYEPRIKLADGGAVNSFSSSGAGSGGTGSGIQMKAETHVVIYQSADGSIQSVSTETYLDTPQGKQKVESIVEAKIYENKSSGKIPTAINRVNKGQG